MPSVLLLPGLLAMCTTAHCKMPLSPIRVLCLSVPSAIHSDMIPGRVKSGTAAFHVWRAFLVEASSHKGFDGLSPQQSGRDDMLRLAALSASLQDTVGRPWHGQTNHIFGLVMFRPLLHPDAGTCWFDLLQRSVRLSQCR